MDKDEKLILTLLPKGMDHPLPQKKLVKKTGWSSRRVRRTIYRLTVIHHLPVGARYEKPNNGYFVITNDDERATAIAPLASQIKQMQRRVQAISIANLGREE